QDTIMKSIDTAIFSITNDGTMIHFNEAAEKIFGCRASWAIGRHYFETMAPKEREKMRSSFDYVMKTGNTYTGHFVEMTRLDNRVIYLNPLICPWLNREAEIIGAIGIMTDETENKRFQDHLIRAEKMAVLGQIAAQVSHELMNPLASIRGFARIIQKNEPAESKYYSYSKTIIEQVDRIKNVVRDLLDFGRPDKIRHESVDVNIAVQNAVNEVEVDIDRVKVLEQYEKDLPYIDGDFVKIERMVVNLIQNAYQSIQGSGIIEISTALAGGNVLITVKDSGCGIPRQHFNKIFDPYFTNKASGTGLGLAIVKQTVANYGGKINVSSDIGIGSCFTVEFPIKKDKKYE
ncbi:MAG TPA: ATP-binding protein, partial [Syntrophomonas sp.]|nr:ATP-binding protein [Syntrophomonas sp.]